jgi:hypothetical protein
MTIHADITRRRSLFDFLFFFYRVAFLILTGYGNPKMEVIKRKENKNTKELREKWTYIINIILFFIKWVVGGIGGKKLVSVQYFFAKDSTLTLRPPFISIMWLVF